MYKGCSVFHYGYLAMDNGVKSVNQAWFKQTYTVLKIA